MYSSPHLNKVRSLGVNPGSFGGFHFFIIISAEQQWHPIGQLFPLFWRVEMLHELLLFGFIFWK
jgi:hypothetical protein